MRFLNIGLVYARSFAQPRSSELKSWIRLKVRLSLKPQKISDVVIPDTLETHLRGWVFYPCCASDFKLAIGMFGACFQRFLFADIDSRRRSRFEKVFKPVVVRRQDFTDQVPVYPEFHTIPRYEIERFCKGMQVTDYVLKVEGQERSVKWIVGDAVWALDHVDEIAVFFHRNDSGGWGEGSSGIPWLNDELLQRVLAKMNRSGILVTDGLGMMRPEQIGLYQSKCSASFLKLGESALVAGTPRKCLGAAFELLKIYGHEAGMRPSLGVWSVKKDA